MLNTTKLALLCALSLSLTACSGGGKFFNSIDLRVIERDTNSFVRMSSNFDLGNVSLAELQYTVRDSAQREVGSINFSQDANGNGAIQLDVNATLLANANADLGMTMPNGRALPLALNIQRGDSLAVPVMQYSRVYLGGSLRGTLFAGVAFAIRGLDEVMDRLESPVNVFFMFRPSNNLMGVGGVFGGPNPNENGVAVFAKYDRSGTFLEDEIDENMDNEFYDLDGTTQDRLIDFFYGQPRRIEVY